MFFVYISTIACHVIVNRHLLTQPYQQAPVDREPKHAKKKERGRLLLCIIASADANAKQRYSQIVEFAFQCAASSSV